jgi:hypothetical protein
MSPPPIESNNQDHGALELPAGLILATNSFSTGWTSFTRASFQVVMKRSPYEDPVERPEVSSGPVGRRIPTATYACLHNLQVAYSTETDCKGPAVWAVRQTKDVGDGRSFQALRGDTRTNDGHCGDSLTVCGWLQACRKRSPTRKDQGEEGLGQLRFGQLSSARARANASMLVAPERLGLNSCVLS